jgi:hypothetical protein
MEVCVQDMDVCMSPLPAKVNRYLLTNQGALLQNRKVVKFEIELGLPFKISNPMYKFGA